MEYSLDSGNGLIHTVLSGKISLFRFITTPEYSFSLGLPLYLAMGGTREVQGTSIVSYRYFASIMAKYTLPLVALSIRVPACCYQLS